MLSQRRRAPRFLAATAVCVGLVVAVVGSLGAPLITAVAGRAGQGAGLGLIALMMATARDHLSEQRATSTIAMLSVASTAGIGVGHPLAGLLTDLGGIRAAYALVLPPAPPRPAQRIDLPGALLLTIALLGLLIVISQTSLWRHHTGIAAVILALSLLLLAAWTVLEVRTQAPLVDVRLLRHPAIARDHLAEPVIAMSLLCLGVGAFSAVMPAVILTATPASAAWAGIATTATTLLIILMLAGWGRTGRTPRCPGTWGRRPPRIRSRAW